MCYHVLLQLIITDTVALEVASECGPLVGFAHFTSGGFVAITESASKVSGSTNTKKQFACPDITQPNKLHTTNIKHSTFGTVQKMAPQIYNNVYP